MSANIKQNKNIGNVKLSKSGKALAIHIFPDKFLVIPLKKLEKEHIPVFEYKNNKGCITPSNAEIVGEMYKDSPKLPSGFYALTFGIDIVYIKTAYIDKLKNDSRLVFPIQEI